MANKYSYEIETSFPNKKVAPSKLKNEVSEGSAIITSLDYVASSDGYCDLWFKASLAANEKNALDEIISIHDGVPVILTPVIKIDSLTTSSNVLRVAVEKTEADSPSFVSPNWADQTTWYYSAQKRTGVIFVNPSEDLRTFVPESFCCGGPWVDNCHGKYSGEDDLTTSEGDIPRLKVYVDGVHKEERDPHFMINPSKVGDGDFIVDYDSGSITFNNPIESGQCVTADLWKADDSLWIIRPSAGKMLKMDSVEVQFSQDISLRDTVLFETYGYIDVFAPHLLQSNGGPYPSGTKIPIQTKKYKTMQNFIDEANGSLPVIPRSNNKDRTWRDVKESIVAYPWNYKSVLKLSSAAGMEVRIRLEHNDVFSGYATATFYCLSYDE